MSVVGNPVTLGGGNKNVREYDGFSMDSWYSTPSGYNKATGPTLPQNLNIKAPYCSNFASLLSQHLATYAYNLGVIHVTIDTKVSLNINKMFYRNTSVKSVTFINGVTISGSNNLNGFCSGATALEEINGTLDVSVVSNSNVNYTPFACDALKTVRFAPSTIKFNITFTSQVLTDETLVSVANGLNSSTAYTMKVPSTPYARCSTLMGTVSDGVFTQDENGTVTLASFITSTKGWTLST